MHEVNRRQTMVVDFLRLADSFIIIFAAMIAYKFRFNEWIPNIDFWGLIAIAPLLYLVYMHLINGYRSFIPSRAKIGITGLTMGMALTFCTLMIWAYFSKTSAAYSRLWTGQWIVATIMLVVGVRLCVTILLRHTGHAEIMLPQAVILTDDCEYSAKILDYLDAQSEDMSVAIRRNFSIFPMPPNSMDEARYAGGSLENLIQYIRTHPVDYLLLVLSEGGYSRLGNVVDKIQELSVTILSVPVEFFQQTETYDWTILSGIPFKRLSIQPFGKRGWWLKAVEDYVLGSLFLIIAAPVMAVIAIAIKVSSPGPVFFTQLRHGFNGEEIVVFKFRSMTVDRREETNVPQATKDDHRVSKIGRFLRKTSLDELPQLFNVLRGDMSLVGPRPHAVAHNKIYESKVIDYLSRHRVKPGITGWAQVNGWRGETDTVEKMAERVRHDLYYIKHWSPILDLRILLMTIFLIIADENAY